jgi:solute carrier family 35, member C2
MNSLDASAHTKSKRKSSHRSPGDGNRIQEEMKLGSADEELSASDDVELSAVSDDEGLQDDEETGLTGKDKQKRKRRRRRNTLLDQRIAGEARVTDEEKKEATKSVVKNSLINVCLIGLWYLFSLSISIVSPAPSRALLCEILTRYSITSGCLTQNISTSPSHSSPPAST